MDGRATREQSGRWKGPQRVVYDFGAPAGYGPTLRIEGVARYVWFWRACPVDGWNVRDSPLKQKEQGRNTTAACAGSISSQLIHNIGGCHGFGARHNCLYYPKQGMET